jgi:hypothetical protein
LSNQIVKESTELDIGLNLIEAKSILLGMRGRAFQIGDVPGILEGIREIIDLLGEEQKYLELRIQYYELINEERKALPITKERKAFPREEIRFTAWREGDGI